MNRICYYINTLLFTGPNLAQFFLTHFSRTVKDEGVYFLCNGAIQLFKGQGGPEPGKAVSVG